MPSQDRRAAARRRAWGRGPIILRFEPLEGRQLLAATASVTPLPDVVASSFSTVHTADWGDSITATGTITNQGLATAPGAFHVDIYASPTPTIAPTAVKLGTVTIPAGLAPGASSTFDQSITLPPSAIPNLNANQQIYIDLRVDPDHLIPEANQNDKAGLGLGIDTSEITITPPQPSLLIGTALSVTPAAAMWGNALQLTAQVTDNAQGNAPATRARVVLTPAGVTPGGTADVTIGYINIPAVNAWQTINISQSIVLPSTSPSTLGTATSFTLTLIQDADFATNPLDPGPAPRGLGLDQATVQINPNPNAAPAALQPDLAAGTVTAPTTPVFWGNSFQVSTAVENIGPGNAGPFEIRYLLVGPSGALAPAIVLGSTSVPGLQAGTATPITQTLQLPSRLPNGTTINGTATGRIAAVIDPDNTIDEVTKTNNTAESGPVALRLLGTNGTSSVPTLAAPSLTTPVTPAKKTVTAAPVAASLTTNGTLLKARRKAAAQKSKTFGKELEHNLSIFPGRVSHYFKNLFGIK